VVQHSCLYLQNDNMWVIYNPLNSFTITGQMYCDQSNSARSHEERDYCT